MIVRYNVYDNGDRIHSGTYNLLHDQERRHFRKRKEEALELGCRIEEYKEADAKPKECSNGIR